MRYVRTNSVDDTVFDDWNERSAYLLGVLYAEGHVSTVRNQIRIALSENDESWLLQIREQFKSQSRIGRSLDKRTMKTMLTFAFSSEPIRQRLLNWGIKQHRMPPVPDEVFHHFVRGHFDGDGSFYVDAQCRNLHASIVGTLGFMSGINARIESVAGIQRVNVHPKPNSQRAWSIRYASKSTLKLGSFMYQNSTIQLTRKQVLFQQERARKEG